MADDADRAHDEIEAELAYARFTARQRYKTVSTGHCHNCEHPLRPGQLFCDQECAVDFENANEGGRSEENDIGRDRLALVAFIVQD